MRPCADDCLRLEIQIQQEQKGMVSSTVAASRLLRAGQCNSFPKVGL
jgi:hypothetical protein